MRFIDQLILEAKLENTANYHDAGSRKIPFSESKNIEVDATSFKRKAIINTKMK